MPTTPDRVSVSLERVLVRFADRVRSVGVRFRLNGDDLDELFQQVRIRLWQAQRDPDTIEASPASYVYRTAVTAAVDLLRRRQSRREEALDDVTVEAPASMIETAHLRSVEQTLDEQELTRCVTRALDRVMASRRPVVRMHLAGYKPDEIANVLGWTTVKTRNLLYRGLADLREELAVEGITSPEDAWNR